MMESLGMRIFNPIEVIRLALCRRSQQYLQQSVLQQTAYSKYQPVAAEMRQFETEIYPKMAPFGTSLFHREIEPKEESFLEMMRFTFFPYFETYTFCFFWIILISFVFFYSQSYRISANYIEPDSTDEFLKVSQAALFELGENYPYHIVYSYHYYRVLTSMVLFRNFHHYIVACLGVLTIGSYVQKAIGFKRCFVLAITTGVVGILCNNVFNKNVTVESITPISGIIGHSLGYLLAHSQKQWKFYLNEKVNMLLLLLVLCFLEADLIVAYSNINIISNVIALGFGFLFCFADPDENTHQNFTIKNIVVILIMAGGLTAIIIVFFFHTKPTMIEV